MLIRWTVPAAGDLESIKNYLQQHHPHFTEPTVRTIYRHVRLLKSLLSSAGPATLPVQGNLRLHRFLDVVVYSLKAESVEILHIYHGAQDWR